LAGFFRPHFAASIPPPAARRPFGLGGSGTGPKAGGPRYLHRFATERTLTVDLAATGGNPALLSLDPEE
jgi:RHH-type proline utilization regulon transcriptional repressor/proline dehydrogenase/delta 1-pyrroline-5-carboxylate dehydrogenase